MKSFLLGGLIAVMMSSHAHAELNVQFDKMVGEWNILGAIVNKDKQMVSCSMKRDTLDGKLFMAVVTLQPTQKGLVVFPSLAIPSSGKPNTQVTVNFLFDNKVNYNLIGHTASKFTKIDLGGENDEATQGFAQYFQMANKVKITSTAKGQPTEVVNVDLRGSSNAFEANQDCLVEMLQKVIADEKPANKKLEDKKPENQEEL